MLIYRLPRGIISLEKRSYCPKCKHKLGFTDLIPLISFLALGAKCRYCQKSIPWRYFIVEFLTALLFTLTFWKHQSIISSGLFLDLLFISVFILIFFIDLETMIIPDILLAVGFATGVMHLFVKVASLNIEQSFWHIIWGLIWFSLFFLIYFFTKSKGMGFGDVKYAGVIGFIFGPISFYVILNSFIVGGIWASVLVLMRKKTLKERIPFGPFLSLSAIIFLLK